MHRRNFLKTAAAAAAACTLNLRGAVASTRPVRLGIIGAGSRGQELLRQFLHVPGVSLRAACDIYPPRQAEVNRLAGATIPFTADATQLLHREDLDAIVIASPLALHAQHVLAACETGRPIYGEKSMGFQPAECQAIVDAVRRHKIKFQVGHQYRYASWAQESFRRIRAGAIGKPTHIYAYWHRNSNWRRPVPSPDPGGRLEHLINWRLYRESSGGLVTELGSHHLDMANWIFGEQPASVLGTTSICRYHDGRTVGDNVQATFHYSDGRNLVFSSITDNAKNGDEFWVFGDEGSIQITLEDAVFYRESKKWKNDVAPPGKVVVEHGIATGASYSATGEMPYRGEGEKITVKPYEDTTLTAVRSFIEAVRGEHAIEADEVVGFGSSIACAVAHDAVFAEEKRAIPALRLT